MRERRILSSDRRRKFGFLLLLLGFSSGHFLFAGSEAAFQPSHGAAMDIITDTGTIYNGEGTPGYHIIGALVMEITGIPPSSITTTPVLVFVSAPVIYTLLLKISGEHLIAGGLTGIRLMSGTTGTPNIFGHTHGFGYAPYYLFLLALLSVLYVSKMKQAWIISMGTLTVSVLLISYDVSAILFLFLGSFILAVYIYNYEKVSNVASASLSILLVLLLIEFGIKEFVYAKAAPLFLTSDVVSISAIDKFFLAFFGGGSNELSHLYYTRPEIITQLSLIKYAFLSVVSIWFGFVFLNRSLRKKPLPQSVLIPMGMLGAAGFWILIRAPIGKFAIASLAFPATIALLWFYQSDLESPSPVRYRNIAAVLIIVIVSVNLALVGARASHGLIEDRNISDGAPKNLESFLYQYHNNGEVRTDIKTWFRIGVFRQQNREGIHDPWKIGIGAVDSADIQYLIGQDTTVPDSRYYVIDHERDKLTLQNWIHLQPWREFYGQIDSTENVQKIYTDGRGEILQSKS